MKKENDKKIFGQSILDMMHLSVICMLMKVCLEAQTNWEFIHGIIYKLKSVCLKT